MNQPGQNALPIGKRIERERLAARMTVEELARRSGMSRRAIDHIRRGTRGTTNLSLAKLAIGLGKDPAYFIDDVALSAPTPGKAA